MATVRSSTLSEWLVRALDTHKVLLARPDEVGQYLERHDDLAKIVPDICKQARQEFGSSAELTLEVYHDPEVEDSYLTLYVRQSCYDGDTMRTIDRVWQPYESKLANVSGYLLVTTDFRPPAMNHGV